MQNIKYFVDPDFSIYPNPASDKLNILVELRQQGPLNIDIYDINGRQVYSINRTKISQGYQLILVLIEITVKEIDFFSLYKLEQ